MEWRKDNFLVNGTRVIGSPLAKIRTANLTIYCKQKQTQTDHTSKCETYNYRTSKKKR